MLFIEGGGLLLEAGEVVFLLVTPCFEFLLGLGLFGLQGIEFLLGLGLLGAQGFEFLLGLGLFGL